MSRTARRLAAFAAPLLLLAAGAAAAADWTLRPDGSSLRFSGTAQGEAFEGRFAEFAPKIRFDPAALDGARFEVTVKLASADSKNQERDETLAGTDFFDVANYPEARFIATEFAAREDGGFEARGALELRGTRQPVTLVFRWQAVEGGARLEGEARLDRTAFGVGGGDWADPEMIAHEVEVKTTLVLAPAG
jgi:polyisoprenoid-binding protein YceI